MHASVAVAAFGVATETYGGRHEEYFGPHLPAATRDWAGQCGHDRGSVALTGPCWPALTEGRSVRPLTKTVIGVKEAQ
jgi:hypothetical protein